MRLIILCLVLTAFSYASTDNLDVLIKSINKSVVMDIGRPTLNLSRLGSVAIFQQADKDLEDFKCKRGDGFVSTTSTSHLEEREFMELLSSIINKSHNNDGAVTKLFRVLINKYLNSYSTMIKSVKASGDCSVKAFSKEYFTLFLDDLTLSIMIGSYAD